VRPVDSLPVVRFSPVPLPACDPEFRPDGVAGGLHDWAASEPMRALVAAFGGALPELTTGPLLAWLAGFSGEHWDFRRPGGVERDQVRAPVFTPETRELIFAAAAALRLTEAAGPPRSSYDQVLVPGGLGRSCLQRTGYAAELLRSGAVTAPELTALSSFRPLTAAERELPQLAGLRHEVDAMDAGVRSGFGLTGTPGRTGSTGAVSHRSWEVRTYGPRGPARVHVLAAPSSEPGVRRANTPDTYEFWAGRVRLRATDRILVVTSPIYVPFQHCDAIRMLALRHGCGVDTVGCDPARSSVPPAPGASDPDRYLQEIRSGILSMQRLHAAVVAAAGP
jgi:hypothetical protein